MAGSRTRAEIQKMNVEILGLNAKCSENNGVMLEIHKSHLEEAPSGQIWNNFDYNRLGPTE